MPNKPNPRPNRKPRSITKQTKQAMLRWGRYLTNGTITNNELEKHFQEWFAGANHQPTRVGPKTKKAEPFNVTQNATVCGADVTDKTITVETPTPPRGVRLGDPCHIRWIQHPTETQC